MSLPYVQDEIGQHKVPAALNEDNWERLSVHFSFKNGGSVMQFVERNLFLVDVLIEARKKIDHYFGSDTLTSLEVFTDPEEDHSGPILFVLILTPLRSDDASGRFERLDQEWWLDQRYEVKRAMNIDVEYADGGV